MYVTGPNMSDTDLEYNRLQNGIEVGRESVWEKEQELFEV